MAAEARYNDAKQNWLQAASQARTQKEAAKANYDEDKEMGITNQPFEQWVASNVSALASASPSQGQADASIGTIRD